MAQKYISYIQTENLFKALPTLLAIKESLQLDIDRLGVINSEEIDDYIYTQVIGNKVLSDTPPSGKISDTTGDVAESHKHNIDQAYDNALKSIKKDRFSIDLVDDKLNIALRRLPLLNQQILKLFYWEKKTWAEVLEELKISNNYMTKRQVVIRRKNSLEKIQSISKITVETYANVIRLMEVE